MSLIIKPNEFFELIKYPRTPHIEGSRLQYGDENYGHTPYKKLLGKYIVVEEKLDGANCALRFNQLDELFLQSRGHFLNGGGRERQFALLKKWANVHAPKLLDILTDRYVVYGEWLHKKHSIFYDNLPTYFAEFDIWDRQENCWLDTTRRQKLLAPLPILSVPVLYKGLAPKSIKEVIRLLKPSLAKSANWKSTFQTIVYREGLNLDKAWSMTDSNECAEGLYIKVEENGQVIERYKWIRHDFVQSILSHNIHHSQQPFIPNQLRGGVNIYDVKIELDWHGLAINQEKVSIPNEN